MLSTSEALSLNQSMAAVNQAAPLKECNKTLYMKQFFRKFINISAYFLPPTRLRQEDCIHPKITLKKILSYQGVDAPPPMPLMRMFKTTSLQTKGDFE
jgi:hypothetical protein